jgi:hypothetical protein
MNERLIIKVKKLWKKTYSTSIELTKMSTINEPIIV